MQAWFHRWRWWTRLALAVIILPWFGRFTYVRMTTLPADPKGSSAGAEWFFSEPTFPEGSPIKVLLDAIPDVTAVSIPAPATAPAGKQWAPTGNTDTSPGATCFLDPYQAANGRWLPQERYYLQQIIAWLETPKVESSLSQVATLAAQPLTLPPVTHSVIDKIRGVCKMLRAHARYCMAQKHDLLTASRDIKAVFDLSQYLDDAGPMMGFVTASACRSRARDEMLCWCREFNLTLTESRALITLLDAYRLEMPRQWNQAIQAEGKFAEQTLDAYYSKNPDGTGWFVIHPRTTGDAADTALSALNVLSPFLSDRRTILAKQGVALRRAILATNLPYDQVVSQLGRKDDKRSSSEHRQSFNPADGHVFLPAAYGMYASLYRSFVRDMAEHSATRVALALSAWRTQHGQYPSDLAQLVPNYASSISIDPFDLHPLRYRLDDRDGYSLYSIGEDGKDDGGPLRNEKGELYWEGNGPDWTFPGERSDPDVEWFLVPATQPVSDSDKTEPQ